MSTKLSSPAFQWPIFFALLDECASSKQVMMKKVAKDGLLHNQ